MKRASRSLALLFLAAGCGGGGAVDTSAPATPTFTSLSLSATTITIAVGGTYQLQVVAKDQFGAPIPASPATSFVSSDDAVATVSAAGLVTGVAPGRATVTASATMDGVTRTTTCQVTIGSVGLGNTVSTAGLKFSPATFTIAAGDSITWLFVEAPHNVTFTGAAPGAGSVPTQQPGALATRVFATPGTYAYECTIHNGMQGSVVVQGGQAPAYTSLALAPATPALAVGGTVQLTAVPLDQNGSAMAGLPAPTFSITVGTAASVNATGLVTGLASGTATVTASLTAAGVTHTANSTVTVTSPVPGSATVTTPNQTFSPPTVTIAPGGQVTWQFSGSTHNVTFTGAAPAGGNIPDVQPGNAVSRTFATVGNYPYQCTRHNGMTGTVVVQGGGGGGVFTSLSVTPVTSAIGVGATVQLTATPRDQNGAPIVGLPAATFTSGNGAVATATSTGLVTGVAAGSATITATLTDGGVTHSGTAAVTVAPGGGGGVTISTAGNQFTPDAVEVPPGTTVTWNFVGTTHNVTFDAAAPAGGNIPDTAPGNSVARTFTVPGDYDYRCTIHSNMKGRVRVR